MIASEHIKALTLLAGDGGATTDKDILAPHLKEWRDKYTGKTQLMVMPDTTEKASEIVRYCNIHHIALVPQGGNTGLVGGGLPGLSGRDEILFSTKRMNKILQLDAQDYSITAEAGVTISELQAAANRAGRLFPLSLASEGSCTVGGTISTNAGGVHVIRYGTMRELTLGLEAVLPDGSVFSDLSPLRKDNTGYNLKALIAGSEGSLGIITKASLKLAPPEVQKITLWIALDDIDRALGLMDELRTRSADRLSVFEIMPRGGLNMVLDHISGTRDPLPGDRSPWYVLAEIGSSIIDSALESQLEEALEKLMTNGKISNGIIAKSDQQRQALWTLRESLSEAQKYEGGSIKHDISVPTSKVPEFLKLATPRLEARWPGCRVTPFGHLGDGNLHYNIMQPKGSDKQKFLDEWQSMNSFVHDMVTEFGGSISAEHGIGLMKAGELQRLKPEANITAMKAIKATLDPNNIMNPGVLFLND